MVSMQARGILPRHKSIIDTIEATFMFKHKYFYRGKIMCHSNFAVDIAKIYA